MKKLFLLASHTAMLGIGFALGVYFLPILTAPDAPSATEVEKFSAAPQFSGTFKRDLPGSDFLHWGEGKFSISNTHATLMGELAPGPDYKLYLTNSFVQNEAEFNAIKDQALDVGNIKTFDNFVVKLADGVDPSQYTTAVVWCESFGEFITATQYR